MMSVVLWADACQVGGTTFTNVDQDRYPVLTVGIIVKETKDTLHLARDTDGEDDRPWRAVLAIPTVLILERRDYKIAAKFRPTP